MKRKVFLSLASLVFFTFIGCSDDPVTPPPDPNLGKLAPITLFHAHNDLSDVSVVVRSQDTIRVSNLAYGKDTSIKVQIGTNSKLSFSNLSGSTTKAIEAVVFDSLSTWLVFSGSSNNYDAFTVSTQRITSLLAAGEAGVRVINAAQNLANKITVKQNSVTGVAIAADIDEKASSSFVSVPAASITKFVVTDNASKEIVSLTPQVPLEAGKLYTVIVYGSGATSSLLPVTGKIVMEP
jgi:hypothetical protein